MARSFNPQTLIYTSPRPPVNFPSDHHLSLTSFLFQSSSSFPNNTALIDDDSGETLTFLELKTLVSNLSHALRNAMGIKKGDVVLIVAANSIRYPICFFAIAALGAITTTCNPAYTFFELSKQVKDCNPKLVITVPELYEKTAKFNLPAIILDSSKSSEIVPNSRVWSFSDLIKTTAFSDRLSNLPASDVTQSDVAALMYSSGTTGTSKGVILTHRNFITSSLMVTADQDWYGDPNNVFLCFVPMFHIFGLSVIAYSQLRRGNTLVSMAKFELEKVLRAVEKYRVTHLYLVPPVVIALAKQIGVVRKYDLSSLKNILSGASPLAKDVMEGCAKNVPNSLVMQGYGMTESCGIISMENGWEGTRFLGSTGILAPGIEAQIISIETIKPLPPN